MTDVTRRAETRIELTEHIATSSRVSVNVGQEFVATTTDKVELCLNRYRAALAQRDRWLAPAGILLSLLPSLLGAEFSTFLGLDKAVWKAVYVLASLGAAVWLITELVGLYRGRHNRNIGRVIDDLRRGTHQVSSD